MLVYGYEIKGGLQSLDNDTIDFIYQRSVHRFFETVDNKIVLATIRNDDSIKEGLLISLEVHELPYKKSFTEYVVNSAVLRKV